MKIDWKRKLSSRKFWAAAIGFIASILVVFNVSELTIEQVTTVIGGLGALIAYILAEGFIDAQNVEVKGDEE